MKVNEKLFSKAAAYCAKSEHCASEVVDKLMVWKGEEDADIDAIVERLRKENYISDQRFCESFTRDKFRFNHWGRMKIRMMLQAKGLDSSAIDLAMNEAIEEETYAEALKNVILAKLSTLSADDPQLLPKLYRHVASKGFEYEVFSKVVKEILS